MITINAKKLTSFLSALLLVIGATGLMHVQPLKALVKIFKAQEKPLKKVQKKLETSVTIRAVYCCDSPDYI